MLNKNEIISFEKFTHILNKKIFEGSATDLLIKLATNPERYVGLFRPTKPRTKLMQNITQSNEIKFGDALEMIFELYFARVGYELLGKKIIKTEENDELNIDQLFMKDNIIYLIEQKVRDDHDSTKKRGQFRNFMNKYLEVSKKYHNKEIVPIMWFVDDSLVKNKNYYLEEMNKMSIDYKCTPILCYGDQLFENNFDKEIWEEVMFYLTSWKETLPDMPKSNLDKNAEKVFNEIKDLNPRIFKKIFSNYNIRTQILPILFPDYKVLKLLKEYFDSKNTPIYEALSMEIDNYITVRIN